MISETVQFWIRLNRYSESEVQNNIGVIRRFLANNGYVFGAMIVQPLPLTH